MDKIKELFKKYTMVLILVLVVIIFTIGTNGRMLLPANINNLIAQNAYVFVLATGMLLCILTGGNIDLSVGSVVCFVGAVGGSMMVNAKLPIWLAMLAMIVVGLLIGAWQGFWIAYMKIPPFITTLAGMLVFRGLANVILNGLTLAPMPSSYLNLFNSYIPDIFHVENFNLTCMLIGIVVSVLYAILSIKGRATKLSKCYQVESLSSMIVRVVVVDLAILAFVFKLSQYKGIPVVLIWVAVVILIYNYITSKTTIGRHFYAVGGNEKAAALSGVDTKKVFFTAYINMAFLAAIAGMITIARLNSANPTAGTNYEMDAIGSCFIGGASAYGGIGTVPGVIVGAILMGVINLGMNIMGVDANYQKVVKGLVLLAAVIFDIVTKKKKG
ncbi:MAG: sugar ABC transporter permease [Elusimicrobiaceae bacterium]|nr:sugar ABC transporter permease [Elusimicrobiaceae bacterium]